MPSIRSYRLILPLLTLCFTFLAGLAKASLPVVTGENTAPSLLLQPGTVAPICNLDGLDGNAYEFPASGSWNMIFYWSLFCHSCLEEIPEVQRRLEQENNPDLKAFFVSLDTERMHKALVNFCQRRELKQLVLMEKIASDSWLTADQWGVVSTPAVFIVAPDGKVAYSHQGPLDLDRFFAGFAAMTASATEVLPPEK